MKKKAILLLASLVLILVFSTVKASAMTAKEIIKRRDENEYFSTAKAEAEMVIIQGRRRISKTIVSYVEGDKGLVVFTNPRDRGTKFLKHGDNLWMFFPEAEDPVKISGHMLNQGMMGSDLSYQDLMEADRLTELYLFELIGEEEIDGRPCYVLEGTAVEGEGVSYYRRKSWVDKERFIGLKEEYYARSGRLLKEMKVNKVAEIEGRWYPVESVLEDKLKQSSQTEFIIKTIEFNPEIPANTFTLENIR